MTSQTTEVSFSLRFSAYLHKPVTHICKKLFPSPTSPAQSLRQTQAHSWDQTGTCNERPGKRASKTHCFKSVKGRNVYAVEVLKSEDSIDVKNH